MLREQYDDYIRRFNARDVSTFEDYLAPDAEIVNGGLMLRGVQGMKDHYQLRIWPVFAETIHVERFVSDEGNLAVKMWTHFEAEKDAPDSLFGPVLKGEYFDFRGLVMYRIEDGRFTNIWVAYNSFTRTGLDGTELSLGLPH